MTKRRSDRDAADDIVALLNSEQDKADHPDMKIKSLLQRAKDAGGGPLRMQYLQQAQAELGKLDQRHNSKQTNQLRGDILALQGRGGDTRIAHVTPGEIIIPRHLQTPQMLAVLRVAARAHGIDPARLKVGSPSNSVNPRTGQIEFQDGDDNSDDGPQPPLGDTGYQDSDGNPIQGITVTTPRETGRQQLPQNLPDSGFYNYGTPDNGAAQYGLPSTLGVIGAAGTQWNASGALPFGVGNMSLSNGSKYSTHTGHGHMDGTGIDIRPIRNDGQQGGVSYDSPAYDRAATQKLVDTLRATGGVQAIYFNDPQIKGVQYQDKHNDHLHVQVDPNYVRPPGT